MYTVNVDYANGESVRITYNDIDCAIGAFNELTEFGGDGYIIDENGVVITANDMEEEWD